MTHCHIPKDLNPAVICPCIVQNSYEIHTVLQYNLIEGKLASNRDIYFMV